MAVSSSCLSVASGSFMKSKALSSPSIRFFKSSEAILVDLAVQSGMPGGTLLHELGEHTHPRTPLSIPWGRD